MCGQSLFEIGDAVVISGLKNGNYNGTRGKVVTGINEKGRYGVKLHKIGKSLSFEAHNLSKVRLLKIVSTLRETYFKNQHKTTK